MTPTATKTGPGGTEFVMRSNPTCNGARRTGHASRRESAASRLRQEVEDARGQGLHEKLEQSVHHRQQFWLDTCREVLEMKDASPQVLELHREHGCRFCVPAPRQVQHVLDALDSALPGWDRDHPALFYRTLELNFPELIRVCRTYRRN